MAPPSEAKKQYGQCQTFSSPNELAHEIHTNVDLKSPHPLLEGFNYLQPELSFSSLFSFIIVHISRLTFAGTFQQVSVITEIVLTPSPPRVFLRNIFQIISICHKLVQVVGTWNWWKPFVIYFHDYLMFEVPFWVCQLHSEKQITVWAYLNML